MAGMSEISVHRHRKESVHRSVDQELLQRAIRTHVASCLIDAERVRSAQEAGLVPDILLDSLMVPDSLFLETVVPTLISHDVSLDLFYRAIVAPVTERMGDMWCDDEIDFVQVEIVSMRLRMILNRLVAHHNTTTHAPDHDDRRSVILADAAAEGHNLGLSIVEAFFRDAGWEVDGGAHLHVGPEYYERLARRGFSIIAIGLGGCTGEMDASVISRSRAASSNPAALICIGGMAVRRRSSDYAGIGADMIAVDAPDALRLAEAAVA